MEGAQTMRSVLCVRQIHALPLTYLSATPSMSGFHMGQDDT